MRNMTDNKTPALRAWLRRGLLIGLLVLAGVLLWPVQRQETAVQPTPAPAEAADERNRREAAYDKDIAALEALLQSGAADADTQQQAARRLEALVADHQSELALEEALHAAGFSDAVAVIAGGAVTVLLKQEATAENTAVIVGLCMAHASVSAENIRVMQQS